MDIAAHALWAAVGVAALRRRRPVARGTAVALVGLAAAPDLAQLLPLLGAAAFGDAGWRVLWAYANALPGLHPVLPPRVEWLAHHLHCTMHSALVAAAVTAVIVALTRSFWLPLLGWWSHIVIDVFTHSADFYPSPVLYPLTQRGFDGLAWNTPAFMAANYTALAAAATWLWFTRRGRSRPR
jgi:LexA-binding, inner membrane-associated putative hydrolase